MLAGSLIIVCHLQIFHAKQVLLDLVEVLLNMIALGKTNRAIGCDLSSIGGAAKAGVLTLSAFTSNWKKSYQRVHVITSDASGLFVKKSENLLDLL